MPGWRHFLCEHPIIAELIWSLVLPDSIKNGKRSLEKIIRSGCLKYVVYYHQYNLGRWKRVMDNAAYYGHLDIVKFLHENRSEGCTVWAMNGAAENGHLEMVKFLHEKRTEGCTTYAMIWAAHNGHLNIIKFLHENRSEGCTKNVMYWAANKGYLDIVKFLSAESRNQRCNSAGGMHIHLHDSEMHDSENKYKLIYVNNVPE